MCDEIQVSVSEHILEIRMDRPDKKNAITTAMYAAMADALERAASDADIRAVLIIGSEGNFSAGNDLRDFQLSAPVEADAPVFRFMRAIATAPKVLIAGVEGVAIGIGTTMLLHCDLVVAGRETRFAMPFVDLGLVPEAASSLLFPALVGRQRAARHLLLGDPFDAQTALAYGLATEVVDNGVVEAAARDLARRIAAKAPEALRLTKRLLTGDPGAIGRRMAEEAEIFAQRLGAPELAEAIAAFYEKRPPRFG